LRFWSAAGRWSGLFVPVLGLLPGRFRRRFLRLRRGRQRDCEADDEAGGRGPVPGQLTIHDSPFTIHGHYGAFVA
ncbi:MAG: hypothetical protein JSU71_11890, partial [Betaproteobacteria bacterium]